MCSWKCFSAPADCLGPENVRAWVPSSTAWVIQGDSWSLQGHGKCLGMFLQGSRNMLGTPQDSQGSPGCILTCPPQLLVFQEAASMLWGDVWVLQEGACMPSWRCFCVLGRYLVAPGGFLSVVPQERCLFPLGR